ncbi:MAG: hypothetical protein POH28_04035 [Acidocella sp.]|nr:hypothetical protein [Acidocella sp.]
MSFFGPLRRISSRLITALSTNSLMQAFFMSGGALCRAWRMAVDGLIGFASVRFWRCDGWVSEAVAPSRPELCWNLGDGGDQASFSAGVSMTSTPSRKVMPLMALENRSDAIALYFTFYNFARMHKTLRCSPAMAAGLSTTLWTMEDIIALIDARASKPNCPAIYKTQRNSN